jgi:hypothetical protein
MDETIRRLCLRAIDGDVEAVPPLLDRLRELSGDPLRQSQYLVVHAAFGRLWVAASGQLIRHFLLQKDLLIGEEDSLYRPSSDDVAREDAAWKKFRDDLYAALWSDVMPPSKAVVRVQKYIRPLDKPCASGL